MESLFYIVLIVGLLLAVPAIIPVLMDIPNAFADVKSCDERVTEQVFKSVGSAYDIQQIESLGFRPCGAYRVDLHFVKAYFAVWQYGDDATYLAFYSIGSPSGPGWTIDIVSQIAMDPNVGLTTSRSRDAHMLVSQHGDHSQSFYTDHLSVLWEYHQQAEAFLAERYGVMPQPVAMDFAEILRWSTRSNARYRLRRPWLLLCSPWRFWIGRHLRHNKTVQELVGC